MSAKKVTYFEGLIEADISHDGPKTKFVFQTERIGLKKKEEIDFLKTADKDMKKEIAMTDDELVIEATVPDKYKRFEKLHTEDEKTRWIFAQQLVTKVETFDYPRLHLVVCPENIVYNQGMSPFFLHYGVTESLPPFEKDEERVWLETKATVAAAVDGSFSFHDYIHYYQTLDLKPAAKDIMTTETPGSLLDYISGQIDRLNEKDKTIVRLPQKKWKTTKFISIGLGIALVPALIYIIYSFASEKPKNEAYLDSHEYFLGQRYSQVVTALRPYSVKEMPYIVLYQLAYAYVSNEALTEDQKENVLANITLQTDEDYLKYWIHIGRHEGEAAVELAREMEDGELITYGLLKYREEVKADQKLESEEKQQLLNEIDSEVEEYRQLMEDEAEKQAEEQEKEKEAQQTESEPEQSDAEQQEQQSDQQSEQEQPTNADA